MIRTAMGLLVGDRAKFLGIVIGLAFSSLLITQQAAVFSGVMALVHGHVTDTPQADIWVCDPGLQEMDVAGALPRREVDTVRAIDGIAWAVPLLRKAQFARRDNAEIVPVMVMGVDDATLIGGPLAEAMRSGRRDALDEPYSIIVDEHAADTKLRVAGVDGSDRPLAVGDRLAIGGASFAVVGISRSTLSLMLYPTVYMRRSHLLELDPSARGQNFILAGVEPGSDPAALCTRIDAATGLKARPRAAFSGYVYDFFLYRTGIPANFGIAVLLGFLVGAAITGQTFHQFVIDNRRVFAALKAMGMRHAQLAGMLCVQALVTAIFGFGIGVGGATLFGIALAGTDLSFRLTPALLLVAGASVLVISIGSALLSLRLVLRLDPAQVFRS